MHHREKARDLEADYTVGVGDEFGNVGGSRPRAVQGGKVIFGCPTGNGATLSNVDGNGSFDRLGNEVAQWRQPHPFETSAHIGLQHFGCVPEKNKTRCLARLD